MEDHLTPVLNHFSIETCHIAARISTDWQPLFEAFPNRIASLTLIQPLRVSVPTLKALSNRATILHTGPIITISGTEADLCASDVIHIPLQSGGALWDDVVKDHSLEVLQAILSAARKFPDAQPLNFPEQSKGYINGVSYTVVGSGPPLLLLPMGLAPTAWACLIQKLSKTFCVIQLGGTQLGFLPVLESRGASRGYRKMITSLTTEMEVKPGQSILEVGCGTAVVLRYLASQAPTAQFCGVDISPYLIEEATTLVNKDDLAMRISLQVENGEKLSFEDETFDAVFSTTVAEECNAERLLSEMVRVCKKGGAIGMIVRAEDLPFTLNLPLCKSDLDKFETRYDRELSLRQQKGGSCSSAALYRRFRMAGLSQVSYSPYLATFRNRKGALVRFVLDDFVNWGLPKAEAVRWKAAVETAVAEETFALSWPHHMAVGWKA